MNNGATPSPATEKEEVLQLALVEMESLLKESIIREIELKAERDTLHQVTNAYD